MDKRVKEIFDEEKRSRRPLYYTMGAFIVFLFIWISVINSDSGDVAPSTRDGIQKGRQAIQELKDEVYTKGDSQSEPEQDVDGFLGILGSSSLTTFLVFMLVFIMVSAILRVVRNT